MSQSAWHCEFLPTMHKTSACICEEGRQYKKVSVQEIKMSQSAWHCEFLPTMHKTSVCICEEGRQYKKVSVQEFKMSQSAWHCEFLPTMHKTSVCICEEGRQYKKSLYRKLRCRNQRGIVNSFQQCIRQVYVSARKVDNIKSLCTGN